MKVNQYHNKNITENYVDVHYNKLDSETVRVLHFLHNIKKISGKNNDKEEIFSLLDVAYFEIVDRMCFAYLSSSVLQVDLNLQDILEQFGNEGFVRISKSMIVNVYRIKELKSDLNMRVNLVLENGETVIVNRSYKKEFYRKMENLLERGMRRETNK